MEPPASNFRVIIVGGAVAGLTLAHSLLRNNIDFVVLESHSDIAPQVGASIGLAPNGSRILDQLGLFDEILDKVEPLRNTLVWSETGKSINKAEAPRILHERHGYPLAFLDRQTVLQIMYERLGDRQDRVLTNKKVARMEHRPEGVVVHCADNSVFEGHVVVGADGVRSAVRQHMWDHMEARGLIQEAREERAAMTAEYNCVFGISTPTPGLHAGTLHRTYADGYSFITIASKDSRVYWFFFRKMDKKYAASEIPRLDHIDMDKHVAAFLDKPVAQSVPFAAVYERSVSRNLVPMEEAFYKHWCIDRLVCIGDSAHKMTANMGMGANCAIEGAASLANTLAKVVHDSPTNAVSVEDIHRALKGWEAKRKPRLEEICRSANGLTRIEALATWKERLIALYVLPYLGKFLINQASASVVEAAKLDCEPLPVRSLQCTMPYVSEDDSDKQDGVLKRMLWATRLRFRELKWVPAIAGLGVLTWVVGPGAAFVLGWREELLHWMSVRE
ncbi:FAD/NAD(P)-binding domain-containing protein [Aspergillus ellipticus CBS 707.79]|uniref:FAD/NAD(P)-binding domain-containing protein n=1 Tax=Aspergillus ellipticus CBS 707.79 TaxID=1448320 RepID=A0A319CTL0_9EURO|nr:FAD/NAD(P)-binding domain-containing protein [Aspergillus ellipticus CBS 707.79]